MAHNAETTVSVVIPAYNSQEHIKRAVDSVLAQTRLPEEIIVVDDGSSDNTAQIVASYGSKVKLISQENAGASATGLGALIERGEDRDFGVEKNVLLRLEASAWEAADCPLCREGVELEAPGSRRRA